MSTAQLQFETEDRQGVHVVRISGPLDSMTFSQFRAYMDPLVDQANKRILLDCADLTYLNSRGVALLLHYQRSCNLKLTFFGITEVPPRIAKEFILEDVVELILQHVESCEAIIIDSLPQLIPRREDQGEVGDANIGVPRLDPIPKFKTPVALIAVYHAHHNHARQRERLSSGNTKVDF